MSNEDAPKPQFRIDQEEQYALRLKTDIAYANENFIRFCCALADESYGLGRVVINDEGCLWSFGALMNTDCHGSERL